MVEIISKITTNILTAIYQPFWFSLIAAILFMFLYLYAEGYGWKKVIKFWLTAFKTSSAFRRMFCLAFFVMLMLMRTLLNRNMWENPLSNVMGGWTLYNEKGELTTEAIENVLLMIPYTPLLLWALKKWLLKKVTLGRILWQRIKYAFLTSAAIEFLQLFLRLGTFQLSDLFYNTLGGLLGSLIYYIGYKIKQREKGK